MTTVNIAEGKRDFSRLIRRSHGAGEEVIVTRRGTPVAVLISYEQYQRLKRLEGYRRIFRAREHFVAEGIRADEIYRESRKELRGRP